MKDLSIKPILRLMCVACALTAISSCQTKRSLNLTERLYMQYKRVSIDYPPDRVKNGKGAILSEETTYSTYIDSTSIDRADHADNKLDTNKVYSLSGVTVVSKLRFASLREGHFTVDFVIRVPKELISHDYRVLLTPELMYKDTTVRLEHIVIMGKNFIEKQKQDYLNYDNYLKTIIPEDDYSNHFLDQKGITEDMRRRQKLYWDLYTKERNRVLKYQKWYTKTKERYNFFNFRREMKYREMYHEYQREGHFAAIVKMTLGQDTIGTTGSYDQRFKKRIKRDPYFKINREITEKTVPKKYRDLFRSGISPTEVDNFAVTELDSLNIVQHRYFYDRIVLNEMKDSLRNEVFHQIVPYPHLENVRYSITLNEPQNFTYLYSQEYPIEPGMKNVQIHLKGRIDAIDNMGYTLPRTDTLNYLISSLEELADSTLFARHRMDANYRKGYERLVNRDYVEAIKILNDYNDYNTALSLACQGYNQQAYRLLRRQQQTAMVMYLSAIVSSRLNQKMEAISFLEHACRADVAWVYRCVRDAEIKKLIADYNLQSKLDEIEQTSMN